LYWEAVGNEQYRQDWVSHEHRASGIKQTAATGMKRKGRRSRHWYTPAAATTPSIATTRATVGAHGNPVVTTTAHRGTLSTVAVPTYRPAPRS
jgi:hypothetical protein